MDADMGDGLRQRGSSWREGERKERLLEEGWEKRDLGMGMSVLFEVGRRVGLIPVHDALG